MGADDPIGADFCRILLLHDSPSDAKNQRSKKYRESLAKGDKVVTIGGIHGKILDMEDNALILEMIDKTRIKVEKSAISMESTMALSKENGK